MALSTQEQSMKSEQLIALARSILYSNDYQNKKTRINSDINEYLNRVLNRENAKLEANENDLKMGIVRQPGLLYRNDCWYGIYRIYALQTGHYRFETLCSSDHLNEDTEAGRCI